ncbi:hypothetical protein COCMIDRAFT_100585 [Bipolaris oryzae ATCC 44560]|uniref:C2H2-type domain-containing protein n=1 Tax=Bipolaris oryzae ATCC 44560 TaxID=930090 RepID=W6YVU7_COCMI|nr:uncharacterized protein COCMIDRAFT_100585 [Bipolaris oryzae ATCC 44560]EUC43542.1 hypothetical protein COCMIDRAFT_100585 [Bipolaris oryzae ATCC 44560]
MFAIDTLQFGDLSQIQAMDESRYSTWNTNHDNYMYPYKQNLVNYPLEENLCFDDFDEGSISVPPMQRFMDGPYPFSSGMLEANMPLYNQYTAHLGYQWHPSDNLRHPSPDRTSSGNTSQNTQDELRSPYMYHATPCTGPMEYPQASFPCSSIEQFHNGSYQLDVPAFPSNCTLSQLEYTRVTEAVAEEVEDGNVKQEAIPSHEQGTVKTEETREYTTYADSAIELSTRDAQSVEPVEPIDYPEESTSDSEYNPTSSRSNKRKRATASSNSSSRTSKRRTHTRKDSHTTSPTTPIKSEKKQRRTSKASQSPIDLSTHPDYRRPFPCPFAIYGCKSDFVSKNEWKRHISTQHIKLGYWRCDLCLPSVDPEDDDALYHNDFNRKDLFTQHLRRMHAAPKDKSHQSTKEYPVTEANLPEHQNRCNRKLRDPPQYSSCLFCNSEFEGATSWDERIEHIGHHLEKDSAKRAGMLDCTTWYKDTRLECYLLDEGLIMRNGSGWSIGDGIPCRVAVIESDVESEED